MSRRTFEEDFGISAAQYRDIERRLKRAIEEARQEGDEVDIEEAERELQRFYDYMS